MQPTNPDMLRAFVGWMDEEGGLATFLIGHGASYDCVPDELFFEITNFLAGWKILEHSFNALLRTHGVTY